MKNNGNNNILAFAAKEKTNIEDLNEIFERFCMVYIAKKAQLFAQWSSKLESFH